MVFRYWQSHLWVATFVTMHAKWRWKIRDFKRWKLQLLRDMMRKEKREKSIFLAIRILSADGVSDE